MTWPDVTRIGAAYDRESESSELSWGDGITPPGLENSPPAEGGRYHGKAPDCAPKIGLGRNP